ncbi:MAG: PQQ-binding-like beta-propeller repeat protein [Hyphomonadaceae bacterium]|nr:PQQ-binding-like beta-propeller repeat protein [Hyphomonadaceae bacterium]
MKLKASLVAVAAALAAVAISSCVTQSGKIEAGKQALADGEWPYWGGDPQSTRFSPLTDIKASNVSKLEIVWRWSADTTGSPASANFKSTPLMDDGVLYMPWLDHGAAALDAVTGKTLWTFLPEPRDIGGRAANLGPRSLSYWTDGTAKRLYHNSIDGRLFSIDARTGKADLAFGENGAINLRTGLVEGRAVGDVGSVSPALVVGDVVVVQVVPGGARDKESTPGYVRGFDARTGKVLWTFHTVPQKGEFGYESWQEGAADYIGNTGVWSMMSADPETGYVYMPTDTPSNDFYGGHRKGDGLYGESLLCIDSKTGKRIWHFQVVHHGVWDYDNPAAPILHEITKDGKQRKVVTLLTKQNMVFVFDRLTGEPIWPIEERPVPQSKIPGEQLSPTQPFPTKPAPLSKLGYHEEDLIDFTPELRAEALKMMEQYDKGPMYTPIGEVGPGKRGTLIYPGYGGGANWNAGAYDPKTHILYVPIRHRPNAAGLAKGDPARTNNAYVQSGNHVLMGPKGLPMFKPPWSELIALDMDRGEQLWRVPVGPASDFVSSHPALQGLGLDFFKMSRFDIKPSPLLMADLVFLGESGNITDGTGGPMMRAYDKTNGKVVWEKELPGLVTGAPMTYRYNGKQVIVVAVSKRGQPAELIALGLGDGVDDAVVASASPMPPGASVAAAAFVNATRAELTLGRDAFGRTCAACHGPSGSGLAGGGPSLAGQGDVAQIARTITQGKGEMPAMAGALKPEEADAIAKFVASGFPRGGAPAPDAG